MIAANHIAKAAITINASTDKVWHALTDPGMIKKYMFGTTEFLTGKKEVRSFGKENGKERLMKTKEKSFFLSRKEVCNTVTSVRFRVYMITRKIII